MGEEESITFGEVRGDLFGVELPLDLVGSEDHDQIGFLDGLGHGEDTEAFGLGLGARGGAFPEADADVDTGITEAERVGVTLRAVADHSNLTVLDDREVSVVVVEHFCHGLSSFLLVGLASQGLVAAPERDLS